MRWIIGAWLIGYFYLAIPHIEEWRILRKYDFIEVPPEKLRKQALIKKSRDRYLGPCPCPYDFASDNSMCGKRSAYSRSGGFTVLCYETDVKL